MEHTTKEQNEILTRVGPGTPMGELLRLYWWPVAISADLKDNATFIRLLCEDLVLFRDGKGQIGLLGALCSHRRANLCLGTTQERGIRCRYHGWLYDVDGKLLETPGEPPESTLKDTVQHPSYLVEELGGVIFAYIGPKPAPLLPRFHVVAAEGERQVGIQAFNNSNWLQNVENGMDPYHVSFLHGDVWSAVAAMPEEAIFEETEWGIVYKAIRKGRKTGEYNYREHHLTMPGISTSGDAAVGVGDDVLKPAKLPLASSRWSVPIDDTHTMNFRVSFRPANRAKGITRGIARSIRVEPYAEYRDSSKPVLGYAVPSTVGEEDAAVLDSLGPIVDRESEHLSVVDEGVVMLRNMYLQAIESVKSGKDPKGVVRDPKKNELIIIGTADEALDRWIPASEVETIRASGHGS